MSIFALKMPNYIINPETLLYEVEVAPKYRKHLMIAILSVVAIGLVYLYFLLYTSVFHWDLPKTTFLKKEKARWEAKIDMMNRQIDLYEQSLYGIEQRDDEVYRAIYGLNTIPDALKHSGLGGVNRYTELYNSGAGVDLQRTVQRIDKLTKRVYIQSKGLDEVLMLAKQAGDMISCVPSVLPISPAKGTFSISSAFGRRKDPVYGGYENHGGIDFSTRKGNPVYVTGGGVVEKVATRYNGYGNEILVDHGFGYKTRYAHLNTIEVTEGMKLERGDRIGSVGSTGKSTGPHLHYEVIYRNSRVNPWNYFDINMPEEEFAAMVSKRALDSSVGKVSSTTELLRRRNSNVGR